ncbi:MAG: 30S ribosomal protein S20 [Defluviitaleaceae bacterium]|nr:30S ribosomal protein S20 [Defluviitaleaceae bacterium]MCL2836419.1 30S ribosomal protein S20 [Defluviitaleaceae bacterium]
MANTKSAKKRILITGKKTMRNKMIKSRTKTAVKKAVAAIEGGGPQAQAAFINAASLIDKAKTKGVLHKNTAARRKSRLAKMMNKTAQ